MSDNRKTFYYATSFNDYINVKNPPLITHWYALISELVAQSVRASTSDMCRADRYRFETRSIRRFY